MGCRCDMHRIIIQSSSDARISQFLRITSSFLLSMSCIRCISWGGIFPFSPDFPVKPYSDKNDWTDAHPVCIFFYYHYHSISEIVSNTDKNSTPESRTDESDDTKWEEFHSENTCWNRYKVSDHGNKSSEESIEPITSEKERFCTVILFWSDENVLSIFHEKWLSYEYSENIVVYECSEERTQSAHENRKHWIDQSLCCIVSCWNHDEFRRNRKDRRLHGHEKKYRSIIYCAEHFEECIDKIMHT